MLTTSKFWIVLILSMSISKSTVAIDSKVSSINGLSSLIYIANKSFRLSSVSKSVICLSFIKLVSSAVSILSFGFILFTVSSSTLSWVVEGS